MHNVFIVKDQTDRAAHKAYVRICKTEAKAKAYVAELQAKLSPDAAKLISYESIAVKDYDEAKTSMYVLFDKRDGALKKGIVNMFFSFSLANDTLNTMRAKADVHARKLIYINAETLV